MRPLESAERWTGEARCVVGAGAQIAAKALEQSQNERYCLYTTFRQLSEIALDTTRFRPTNLGDRKAVMSRSGG